MKCRDCAEGKPIGGSGILCILYGIIIGENHECRQKGAKRRERDEDHSQEQRTGAEIRSGGGGAA